MSTPNFSLAGMASGLDTNAIIQALMAADSQPKLHLQYKVAKLQARETGLTAVETQLSALKDAANALGSATSWLNKQTVETSDSTRVTASVTGGVGPGGYQVSVDRLARADQHTFTYTEDAASDQTLTITPSATGSTPLTITIPAGTDAQAAADLINQQSGGPVFATVVTSTSGGTTTTKLVLASRSSGTDGAFTVAASSTAQFAGETVQAAQDASYTVDGTTYTSSDNVVHNGIPGLDLTLKAVTSSPVTVTVGNPGVDADGLADKVQAFVDAYNKTLDTLNAKLDEAPVNNPQSTTDAAKGALHDDTTLQNVLVSLRSTLSQTYGSTAGFNLLSQIGISTGATTGDGTPDPNAIEGRLSFDRDKFTDALATHQSDVRAMLGAATGTSGFAQAIGNVLDPIVQTGGTLDTRETQTQNDIDDYNDQIASMDEALALKEQRYRAQFSAMETALAQAQSQQAWLAGQIASLPQLG